MKRLYAGIRAYGDGNTIGPGSVLHSFHAESARRFTKATSGGEDLFPSLVQEIADRASGDGAFTVD